MPGKDKAWTEEELDKTAEAVGYGAVNYADLKNNRTTNYTFSFDQMLNDKVAGSAEETSRLLLCEATAVVMRKCFHLLGITPVYKI
ncbi:hypothetical protein SASPL_149864 [Salvia splendens]|uniref:arginine--tRNA ligase n=1 Tax=Salvia splendens TaxID=180675 RepID=A0A8X8Z1Z0_SALSN|nr:hypothetical protein SASPL_149864 [Salvia splendens]